MKLRFCLLLMLAACCLTGCVSKGLTSMDDISALVNENLALLDEYIQTGDFSAPPDVDGVLDADERPGEAVHFSCGATGLGTTGTYYGFYYSYDGQPSGGWLAVDVFAPDGDGYRWELLDNTYYTQHITGNFWYYSSKQ